MTFYGQYGKRALDLSVASILLVATAPVMAAVATAVRFRIGKPVVFSQTRPGLRGQPFRIHKFRTMTMAVGADGELLPDSERLTKLGLWLRSTSLDELPELVDVVRGDMSLVGPRPLLMQYLGRYSPEQARRHEARPGITGWAQVNGRNNAGWLAKLDMDVWYVDNCSLPLDLRIMWRTVRAVIRRSDVSESGHVTASEFMGEVDVMHS